MLTVKNLRLTLCEISLFSKLNIIPLQLDQASATFSLVKPLWRQFLSWLQLLFFVTQAANANYTLLQALLFEEYFIIRHFTFHLTLASGSAVTGIWHFMYWTQWPNETVRLFNYSFPVFDGSVNLRSDCRPCSAVVSEGSNDIVPDPISQSVDSEEQAEPEPFNYEDVVQKRTKIDWLALFMPILVAVAVAFGIAIFLYERSIRMLNFYGTFDNSWYGHLFTFLKSSFFLSYMASSFGPLTVMQLLFFERTMEKLQKILQLKLADTKWTATTEMCTELHRLHVMINFFNTTGALPVYALKVLCMILTVSNGCFAIMMFSEHPIMASFSGFVAVGSSLIFSVMYERAFFVAELMKRANLHLRAAINAASDIDIPTKRCMRKRIESVPPAGIKIGIFGTFERATTPIFLDFVVRNIAGLLLSLQLSRSSG